MHSSMQFAPVCMSINVNVGSKEKNFFFLFEWPYVTVSTATDN